MEDGQNNIQRKTHELYQPEYSVCNFKFFFIIIIVIIILEIVLP